MTAIDLQEALVIATFRHRMRIRLRDGRTLSARVKGRKLRPVCGDQVIVEPLADEKEWLIVRIVDRVNQLTRPNTRGDIEVLAANVTLLIAVAANPPKPDWFIIDRYLCAAEIIGVSSAVVYNKADLSAKSEGAGRVLDDYRRIGYPVIESSAKTGENLDQISAVLRDEIAIVVGQSGVGKSSIINALTDNAKQRVAGVSSASGEGKHTTVNSSMLDLPDGGGVIDSPGVRDYAPAIEAVHQVATGFKEIVSFEQDCKFSNCRHLREPHCAVKKAVDVRDISERRYESYKRLMRSTEKLAQLRR